MKSTASMTRLNRGVIWSVVASLSLVSGACGKDVAASGGSGGDAKAISCSDVVAHTETIPGFPTFKNDESRQKAVRQCGERLDEEAKACVIAAEGMDALAKCMKAMSSRSHKDTTRATASAGSIGSAGVSWEPGDFDLAKLKNGRLPVDACSSLLAGVDSCRKRVEAKTGKLPVELFSARRSLYVKVKKLAETDATKAFKVCDGFRKRLEEIPDCYRSVLMATDGM